MLKDSPIVILDEATAFADPDNEVMVQKAFSELAKNRTVIMIAHVWRTENLIFIIIYILYIENNIDMMYNAVTIKSDLINIVTEVLMKISSEARFTTFEAVSMIVGNSIGTGIIAVPYLAPKNRMLDVVWMVVIA